MRQVAITEDQGSQHPWIAVDKKTGQVLLRMQRLEMLLRISTGLGWKITTQPAPQPQIG